MNDATGGGKPRKTRKSSAKRDKTRPGAGEGHYPSGAVADYVEPPWTPVAEPVIPEHQPAPRTGAVYGEEAVEDTSGKAEETISLVGMRVGGELYGIDIMSVKEVVRMRRITPAPNSAPYLAGVINLRGEIIPVISLRLLFGLPKTASTAATRIVIIAASGGMTGLIVDEAPGLRRIPAFCVAPPMEGVRVGGECVTGVAKDGDEHITILDMEKALARH